MIRHRIISLITTIVCCSSAIAQYTLSGYIVNTNNKPIPFANVVLYNVGDTVPTAGCIAEFDGAYKISAKANSYCIRISYVGYKTITDTIALDIDAIRNFTLEEQTTDLTEVSVRAQSVVMSTEKNTYFISPSEAKNQQNALSLLNIVPKISVDMVSNAVTGVGGKSVKLLLNGVDVNSVELRSISPNKIAKIERYDIPPARYSDYEIVLNIVTKEIEDGFMASVDLSSALTTGFSDPQVTMQYNWRKKNRLTIDYYLGYRNYKHQVSDYSYAYVIDDVRYQEKGHLDKAFGYEQHIPNISYVRQDSVNMLQIKLSPKYTHVHSDADSTRQIMKYHTNANVLSLAGPYNWQNREFNPILDIYYSRLINDKNELAIDITATHFSTRNSVDDELIDSLGNAFLCNHANEKNKKTSLIGEVYYSHKFENITLKSGYTLNTNEQKSDASNVLGEWNDVATSFTSNYVYAELSGKLEKWGYNITLGVTNRQSKSIDTETNAWIFMPRLVLSFQPKPNSKLTLQFNHKNTEPSISQLRNSQSYVSNNIIYTGNPNLTHSLLSRVRLGYEQTIKNVIELSVEGFYNRKKDAIVNLYSEQENVIYEQPQNVKSFDRYGAEYALKASVPFGQKVFLMLQCMGSLEFERLYTSQIDYTHAYAPFAAGAQLAAGKFIVMCTYNNASRTLSGLTSSTNENGTHLGFGWQPKNNLLVYAKGLFVGSSACKYHTRTVVNESPVSYDSQTRIKDNGNMVVLGLQYSLSVGKMYNQRSKKINNSDNDSGTFFK